MINANLNGGKCESVDSTDSYSTDSYSLVANLSIHRFSLQIQNSTDSHCFSVDYDFSTDMS
jgi:hypothetical protein